VDVFAFILDDLLILERPGEELACQRYAGHPQSIPNFKEVHLDERIYTISHMPSPFMILLPSSFFS
jgi:hypothetical protein